MPSYDSVGWRVRDLLEVGVWYWGCELPHGSGKR